MADNPPAFPKTGRTSVNGDNDGMTLRDWFAGQALAGTLADTAVKGEPEPTATYVYSIADAMLAERGRKLAKARAGEGSV